MSTTATTNTAASGNGKENSDLLRQYYSGLYETAEGCPGVACIYSTNGNGKPRRTRFSTRPTSTPWSR